MNFVSSITLAFKDAFSSGFNDAKNSLADMKGALDEIGQNNSMTRLAADMAVMTSMTDPMRKALSEAMDQPSRIAGSLDSSFRDIQVNLGATNEEMSVMRRGLLEIGGRAVAGPEAVAKAFSNVAGGIEDASKHMAVMNASVALAEANQADLALSTNTMINVMNAWNLSAENAALAADILTQTSIMGNGSLDDFAGSISSISALAANAGIGLDELGASFSYLSTKSINAGQAQKQLKGIISTLVSPGESLAKLYESLGIESGQAMIQQYGLAESLYILKNAIGDDQAFAGMIGSAEASMVALALTEDAYVSFAGSFAEGMGNITESARGVQLESIEAKMARLDSASRSLQAQIGQDINGIKGFFIDFKFGFLSNIVSPLMSSPVGGALSKIAAGVGMAAKTMLDMGSGALNAAAQMATLAANIHSAGGIAELFHSGIGLLGGSLKMLTTPLRLAGSGILGIGKSIIGALPAIGGYIASMWASVAATIAAAWPILAVAAAWPILAVAAAVALVAGGVYLLIKNWDKVTGFFKGLWDKITGFFSAAWEKIKGVFSTVTNFFKNIWGNVLSNTKAVWEAMPGFFSNIWSGIASGVTAAWNAIGNFFSGIWEKIKGAFSAAWDWIKNLIFGTSDWILGAVAIFMPIVGIPALIIKHWDSIKDFFGNLWGNIKSVFQGFIDWLSGKVEAFTAPFKAIGDVVGGVFSKVGGFFKGIFGGGKESGAALNDAFASGIQSNASVTGEAFSSSLQTVSRQLPHSDAEEGPLSRLTASGRALTDTFASGMDESALREKAGAVFSTAMPHGEGIEISSARNNNAGSQTIHIQNLYVQAEECQSLFDFIKVIMHSVNQPQEVPA